MGGISVEVARLVESLLIAHRVHSWSALVCRLFAFNDQQSKVRGYLVAINFYHEL